MPITVYPANLPNAGTGNAPSAVTVTTTSGALLAANTNRRWVLLTNVGVKDVFLAFGSDAAEIDKGGVLTGSGGSVLLGANFMCLESINGIVKNSTSTVLILEGE